MKKLKPLREQVTMPLYPSFIVCPSENYDRRPEGAKVDFLILHATECSLEKTLDILTDTTSSAPVSAHYVIAESGEIYVLVPECFRAWHAGHSAWLHFKNLNAVSIGIELVNVFPAPFSEAQMESLGRLSRDIVSRHCISPTKILAHSDIALGRKVDPGPLLDWQWLAKNGVGIHPFVALPQDSHKPLDPLVSFSEQPKCTPAMDIGEIQNLLKTIGYGIECTGTFDPLTQWAVRAFQMKFHPNFSQEHQNFQIDAMTLFLLRLCVQRFFEHIQR